MKYDKELVDQLVKDAVRVVSTPGTVSLVVAIQKLYQTLDAMGALEDND